MQARLKTSAPRILAVGTVLLVGLSLWTTARVQAGDSRAGSTRISVTRDTDESLVGTLEQGFPALVPRLRLSSSFEETTWRHGEESVKGFRTQRKETADSPDEGEPVDVVFPARASGPVVAEGEGVRVILRPRGARPAPARVIDGKLSYLGVYRDTDSLHIVDNERTEEYLYLRSAQAPVRFEYDVLETRDVSSVRIERGRVYFRNADDQGLVILAPVVVDAAGRRSATAARWELENEAGPDARRLVLHFEPAGLEYPLVIDPTWITTGPLGVARSEGIGILLQNGKVLVMGRSPQAEIYDIATGTWSPTGPGWLGYGSYAAVLLRDGRVLACGGSTSPPLVTYNDCFLYDPITNTWPPVANMLTARRNHTATLLQDGTVLVTGGENAATIATSEIYNPASNTWVYTTQPLSAGGKAEHTATLLRGAPVEGHVMVAGGVTGVSIQTPITEIYNPATGIWTQVANLNPPRSQHTATLMRDGRVLAVGGVIIPFQPLADIYDPVLNTWTPAPVFPSVPRYDHSATLLPSGRVLVVGGTNISPLNTAEIYHPVGDPGPPPGPIWNPAPNMDTVRNLHSATMLPDGRVLVAGGFDAAAALPTVRLLDVDEPAFVDHNAMTIQRSEHTMTPLADGRVLAAGGAGPGPTTAERYDPVTTMWTPTVPPTMTQPRWRHTATRLMGGRVLMAGSAAGIAAAQSAEVYDPAGGTWTAVQPMSIDRYWHTATLLPCGEVLVAAGRTVGGVSLPSAERFNPRTNTWAPTGPLTIGRQRHTATLLLDGRVLVTGGWNGGALNSAEIYDPATGNWSPTAGPLNVPREYHRATLLPTGHVLLVGGFGSPNTAELFDPATGMFSLAPNLLFPHDFFFTTTLLPNGRVLVVGGFASQNAAEVYDPVGNLWLPMPATQNPLQRHAAAILPNGRVLFSGGGASMAVEYFDVGRREQTGWRSTLIAATDPLVEATPLVAVGIGFMGQSEGSGGRGYVHSATNYPLVQLHRLDNDAVRWLPLDPAVEWKDTDFASLPVNGFTPGPTRVTVFSSGIPSDSSFIEVECPAPTVTTDPIDQNICVGDTVNFTVDGTGPCRTYQWRIGGSPLSEAAPFSGTRTDTLTVTNATLFEAGSYDAVVELSCSSTPAFSAAAVLTVAPALSNVAVSLASGSPTVCATCVGGTISESHLDGGVVTHEWGYRTVSGTPPITWMPGQTGPTYDIDGADFPGPGTYYIVARTTPACGLPLVSSNEVTVTVTPLAPAGDEVQFFTVTSRDRENVLEWVNSGGWGDVRILYNEGAGCTFPTDPLGPSTGSFDWPGIAGLRNSLVHGVPLTPPLTNDMDYCYTIFSNMGGPPYSVGVSNRGRPMDPGLGVIWSFSTGTFSLTAPTVGWSGIIATSNDHVVHAMQRGVGGGEWPAAWLPIRLINAPVQSRSPIVPITVNGANPVVYLGAQDGSVYVVDADQGGAFGGFVRGPAPLGGSPGQAAPAGIFTAFGGAHDYLLVGTRDTGIDNRFFAFDPDLNVVNPPFNNGGGGNGIGIINSMATVDYASSLVYFTSHRRSGGSQATLWCLQLQAVPPPVFTLAWPPRNLGDIDSSPVLMGGRVLVGGPLSLGTLHSIDAATGNPGADYVFDHDDGQVKGFVFPDWRTGDLYFATDNFVWALHDDGASISKKFPGLPLLGGIDLGGGVVPTSAVVFVPGSTYVYVGGDDGKLYEIDVSPGPAPIIKSVQLGDGLATVGAPSLDWQNNLIHVGTEAGVFYAVEVPFP